MGDKQENSNHLVCSDFIETKNFPEIKHVCYLVHSYSEYCLHCHTLFSHVLELHTIRIIRTHFLCVSGFLMSQSFIMLLILIVHSMFSCWGALICMKIPQFVHSSVDRCLEPSWSEYFLIFFVGTHFSWIYVKSGSGIARS